MILRRLTKYGLCGRFVLKLQNNKGLSHHSVLIFGYVYLTLIRCFCTILLIVSWKFEILKFWRKKLQIKMVYPIRPKNQQKSIQCRRSRKTNGSSHSQRFYGNKWAMISRLFPGRIDNVVKNHWMKYIEQSSAYRKRNLKLSQADYTRLEEEATSCCSIGPDPNSLSLCHGIFISLNHFQFVVSIGHLGEEAVSSGGNCCLILQVRP